MPPFLIGHIAHLTAHCSDIIQSSSSPAPAHHQPSANPAPTPPATTTSPHLKMATDFIMPVLSEPHHHKGPLFQHHEFRQQPQPQQYQQQPPGMSSDSQQISPLNTSSNGSPTATSPMSHHAQRTRPMYMPAVLRPNKYSSKAAQPKPDSEGSSPTPSNNSSFLALSGLGALSKITRRHTNDSAKCLPDDDDDDELNLDAFPRPTAAPTREHWKVSIT